VNAGDVVFKFLPSTDKCMNLLEDCADEQRYVSGTLA
jgi:hypothetical protein